MPTMLARWTAHPARRRPRDVALVAAVVLVFAGGVLGLFQSVFFALLSAAVLVGSVADFLLPTHYALTSDGVEERRLLRRRSRSWRELRRLQVGRDAALLSPFARPHWLDRYRGITLLLDGADRGRVVDILRERIAPGEPSHE